jgi:hypothetical protein
VIGRVWLVARTHDQPDKMLSVAIYGVSLILLYSASSALHLVNGSERTIFRLRRCDHAAIYILIAGTYTPLCYHFLDGGWRWLMLGMIWTLAIMGAIYKLRFHWKSRTSTLGYVAGRHYRRANGHPSAANGRTDPDTGRRAALYGRRSGLRAGQAQFASLFHRARSLACVRDGRERAALRGNHAVCGVRKEKAKRKRKDNAKARRREGTKEKGTYG